MQRDKKIAFYADISGSGIQYPNFMHALANLEQSGEIISGKIYNVSERKHKEILAEVANRGYDLAPPLRYRKTAQNAFDSRMIVDIMEDVLQNANLDAVAIIAAPSDMVYLYRRLKSYNIFIIALDNGDEESSALINEFLDIGKVEKLAPVKKQTKPKPPAQDAQAQTAARPEAPASAVYEPRQGEDVYGQTSEEPQPASAPEPEQIPADAPPLSAPDNDLDLEQRILEHSSESDQIDDESAELLEEIQKLLAEFEDN